MPYPAKFIKWDLLKRLRDKHQFATPLFKAIITLILYVFLPFCLTIKSGLWYYLPIFYITNIFLLAIIFNKNIRKRMLVINKDEKLQESMNILLVKNLKALEKEKDLKLKVSRYSSLKGIIEDLNRSLDLEYVADKILSVAYNLIASNRGVGIMYLIDERSQKLKIYKTIKEGSDIVIKEKEGDIFDLWVLRHISPLLVEDIKSDFRFDYDKLKSKASRAVVSLAICPLISENRLLGLLRLENDVPFSYSQDDLRFLSMICELGSVALENAQLYQRMEELAIHDALTGLYTKKYFMERMEEIYQKSMLKKNDFSLLMIDIDLFKSYNDKFGHTAGDIVLKKISTIITETFIDIPSIICRFGGEEFCAILEGIDKDEAYKLASELRRNIGEQKIVLRRQETKVTVSIGVASFAQDDSDAKGLLMKADRAMYEAKEKGRNRVCRS